MLTLQDELIALRNDTILKTNCLYRAKHGFSRAYAFIKRRGYVIPEDVKAVAYAALRHRLKLSYEAAADNLTADDIIEKLLGIVPQP